MLEFDRQTISWFHLSRVWAFGCSVIDCLARCVGVSRPRLLPYHQTHQPIFKGLSSGCNMGLPINKWASSFNHGLLQSRFKHLRPLKEKPQKGKK